MDGFAVANNHEYHQRNGVIVQRAQSANATRSLGRVLNVLTFQLFNAQRAEKLQCLGAFSFTCFPGTA
jgi:hypothetical protein